MRGSERGRGEGVAVSPHVHSHEVMVVQELHPLLPQRVLHGAQDGPGGGRDLVRELEVVPDDGGEDGAQEPEVGVVRPGGHGHPQAGAGGGAGVRAKQGGSIRQHHRIGALALGILIGPFYSLVGTVHGCNSLRSPKLLNCDIVIS